MDEATASGAAEGDEEFLARVSWAYHVEGLTQAVVAERLGVTRLRVNKALGEARRRGLVRVSFDTGFAPCLALEARLKAEFGLKRASVAPQSLEAAADERTTTAVALGHILSHILGDETVRTFGIAWGRTLQIALRHIEPKRRPDLHIVSVMGGTVRGSAISSFEITARLASLYGARHSYFPAPLYASSRESRDIIVGQDVFTNVLEAAKNVDALAMAVGDVSDRSMLMSDALPADVTYAELQERGAVGDVLGTVLTADGQPVDHAINDRLIGIDMEALRAIPNVIMAAAGEHKVKIMRAVLSRGVVDTLVTEEETARALLEG